MIVLFYSRKEIMNYFETYLEIAKKATFGQIEQASKWYLDAEKVAHEVARNLDTTLENGASVVSAFSPRERWTTNVAKAIAFSLGEKVVSLGNSIRAAELAKTVGYKALNGPKTNAFARAIAGDENAVVIDVWMLRAIGIEKKSPTQSQYKEIAQDVTKVSIELGLTPRTTQALIWIIVRGSGE